jgi:hypothetical protein
MAGSDGPTKVFLDIIHRHGVGVGLAIFVAYELHCLINRVLDAVITHQGIVIANQKEMLGLLEELERILRR